MESFIYRVSGAGDDHYNGDYRNFQQTKDGRDFSFQRGKMNECWALCAGGLSRVAYISTDGLDDKAGPPPTTGWKPAFGGKGPAPTIERIAETDPA